MERKHIRVGNKTHYYSAGRRSMHNKGEDGLSSAYHHIQTGEYTYLVETGDIAGGNVKVRTMNMKMKYLKENNHSKV